MTANEHLHRLDTAAIALMGACQLWRSAPAAQTTQGAYSQFRDALAATIAAAAHSARRREPWGSGEDAARRSEDRTRAAARMVMMARALGWDAQRHRPLQARPNDGASEPAERFLSTLIAVEQQLEDTEQEYETIATSYAQAARTVLGTTHCSASVHPWSTDEDGGPGIGFRAVRIDTGTHAIDAAEAVAINRAVLGPGPYDGEPTRTRAAACTEGRRRYAVKMNVGGAPRVVYIEAGHEHEAIDKATANARHSTRIYEARPVGLAWTGAAGIVMGRHEDLQTRTFLDACAYGETQPEDLDAEIARWQASTLEGTVDEYLGIDPQRQDNWRMDAEQARHDIEARITELGLRVYTAQVSYPTYMGIDVQIAATSPEEAMKRAILVANEREGWRSLDDCGPTSIDSMIEGEGDPWADEGRIPIPEEFAHKGTVPAYQE